MIAEYLKNHVVELKSRSSIVAQRRSLGLSTTSNDCVSCEDSKEEYFELTPDGSACSLRCYQVYMSMI